jgi:hypothetical protein
MPKEQRWVVNIQPVLQRPEHVLEYLGRYIHRTALSDRAIVACDEQHVTFRYRGSRDGRSKTMKLPGAEFLRRFLQHVPVRGLHRVRAFGLLHSSRRVTLQRLQLLLRHARQSPKSGKPKSSSHAAAAGLRPGYEDHGCRPPSAPPCSSNSSPQQLGSALAHRQRRRSPESPHHFRFTVCGEHG